MNTVGVEEGTLRRSSVTPARPHVGVGKAVRRFRITFLVPIVVLLAIGVAVGLQRSPQYTAESRVDIGRFDLAAPGVLAGFESATRSLASLYSQAIYADPVLSEISTQTGVPRLLVGQWVHATPFPQSPVVRVIVTAPSPTTATQLANAAAQALVAHSASVVGTTSNASEMLADYRLAAVALDAATRRRERAVTAVKRHPSDANQHRADVARADAQIASLRVSSLRAAYYSNAVAPRASSSASILTTARRATSDRRSKLKLLILIAVVAGGLIGVGLAMARANAIGRR